MRNMKSLGRKWIQQEEWKKFMVEFVGNEADIKKKVKNNRNNNGNKKERSRPPSLGGIERIRVNGNQTEGKFVANL